MSPAPRPTSQSPSRRALNGAARPEALGRGRHDVDVAVEDERAARPRPPRASRRRRCACPSRPTRTAPRAGARAAPPRPSGRRPARGPSSRSASRHDLLAGLLVAERRRRLDEAARGAPPSPPPPRPRPRRGRVGDAHRRLASGRHAGERTSALRDPSTSAGDARPCRLAAWRPSSRIRTLPYDWYVDPAVLRLEQERIFAPLLAVRARAGAGRGARPHRRRARGPRPGRRRPRPRRGAPRLRQRVPAPRLRPLRGRRHARDDPVPVPRVDVRPRRLAPQRAARASASPASTADELGLVPVAVDTWGPFVFVNPDPDAAPLADQLGELPALLAERRRRPRRARLPPARRARPVRGELEGVRRELPRVLPLRGRASEPREGDRRLAGRVRARDAAARSRASGPPKNGGGGVYDATGEVERGQFHFLFPNTLLNVMPGRPQPLDRADRCRSAPSGRLRFLDYFVGPDIDEAWLADYLALDDAGRRRGPRARRARPARLALRQRRRRAR